MSFSIESDVQIGRVVIEHELEHRRPMPLPQFFVAVKEQAPELEQVDPLASAKLFREIVGGLILHGTFEAMRIAGDGEGFELMSTGEAMKYLDTRSLAEIFIRVSRSTLLDARITVTYQAERQA